MSKIIFSTLERKSIAISRIDENIIAGSLKSKDSFAYSLVSIRLIGSLTTDFETRTHTEFDSKSADIGDLIIEKSFSLSVIDLEEGPLIHIDYDFDGSGDISLQSDAVIGMRKIMGSFQAIL